MSGEGSFGGFLEGHVSGSGWSGRGLCIPPPIPMAMVGPLHRRLGSVRYAAGERVYCIGERFEYLYLVRRGALKSWAVNAHGHEQILGFHLPGEIVGIDGIESRTYQSCVEALRVSDVLRLPYARLGDLGTEIPEFRDSLRRIVGREFLFQEEHALMMSSRPAIERVAFFLQTIAIRRVTAGNSASELELDMSRADIANYLALTRETVSRMLGQLAREHTIHLDRRRIRVLDHKRLAEISGEEIDILQATA